MKKATLWLAETAAMLATLIVIQAVTKPVGQLLTGTLVNAILGITVLVCGKRSGIVVALLSPIVAFLLGIAPQILTVPAIMAGNLVFVLILGILEKRPLRVWPCVLWGITAAAAKFIVLYLLVAQVLCRLMASQLMEKGLLKLPMVDMLTATFTWPQLITALLGVTTTLWVAPLLRKALHR